MGRLTSAEYAKLHGAAAGKQLHQEREARIRLVNRRVERHGGGDWIPRNARQFVSGMSPSLDGSMRNQTERENRASYRAGGAADRILGSNPQRPGALRKLAELLSKQGRIFESSMAGPKNRRANPIGEVLVDPPSQKNFLASTFSSDHSIHLRPSVYRSVIGSGRNGEIFSRLGPAYANKQMPSDLGRQVLLHEIVHANPQGKALHDKMFTNKKVNLPLWFAEGEAQAVSRDQAPKAFKAAGMAYDRGLTDFISRGDRHPYNKFERAYRDIRSHVRGR